MTNQTEKFRRQLFTRLAEYENPEDKERGEMHGGLVMTALRIEDFSGEEIQLQPFLNVIYITNNVV